MTNNKTPQPIKKGRYIFDGIQEGVKGKGRKTIQFNKAVVVTYEIFQKKDPITGHDCYPEDFPTIGCVKFDSGMQMQTALDPKNHWLVIGHYEGLTEKSELQDILMYTIIFDLFHAFYHSSTSPTYTYYHWALKGLLKDRAFLVEDASIT